MEIITGLIVIALIIFFISKKKIASNNLPLKKLVQKTFPKYKIIEKHGTIMICEINHRNEPEELVFIRVNQGSKKDIRKSGRMLIADYPSKPTIKELKKDLRAHI